MQEFFEKYCSFSYTIFFFILIPQSLNNADKPAPNFPIPYMQKELPKQPPVVFLPILLPRPLQ